MDILATTRIYAPVLRPLRLLRVSRLALAMSLSLLALAPLSLEGGYSFVLGSRKRWVVEPSLAFGFEINATTDGEDVGEGAIGILGLSILYSF